MNNKQTPKNNRETEAHWLEQIKSWRACELSQAAYCKTHGVVYHHFVYWRRKLEGKPGPGNTTKQENCIN